MRAIALADSDSYAKWGAAMLSRLPAGWDAELIIVRTPKLPSAAQLATALSSTSIAPASVRVLDFDDAVARLHGERPELVVVATIGPLADIAIAAVLGVGRGGDNSWRPVIVSGMPGIAFPERRRALVYRSQADVVVLHSLAEVRRFGVIAERNSIDQEFALSTLPFLLDGQRGAGTDVIFAAQALVPPRLDQRVRLLEWLAEAARREPGRRVVVKVRAVAGEQQTHAERFDYAALLEDYLADAPPNLVVEGGPMHEHLARAAGLVTVSSTAAIEAIAHGVPVLVLDDFGVSHELINEVFEGSGLLGGRAALLAGDFRLAEPEWLADNYFHGAEADTWLGIVEAKMQLAASGRLPARTRIARGGGGTLRRAWDRRRALGRYDRSALGLLALVIGTPVRAAVLGIGSLASITSDAGRQPLALADAATPLERDRQQSRRTP